MSKNIWKRIARNFKRTRNNKISAVALIGIGFITAKLTGDATAFVLLSIFAAWLFFTKRNVIC